MANATAAEHVNESRYHEAVIAKNPLRAISPEDSLLVSVEGGLKPSKGQTMIEIGCGSGLRSIHLAKKYSLELVLVDWTRIAASLSKENARKLAVRCHTIRCDFRYLPIRNSVFDLVWAEGTHEHIQVEQRMQGFNETRRIAKPSAHAVIFVPNTWSPFYRLEEYLKDRTHFAELYDLPFSRGQLIDYMRRSGFRIIRTDGLEVFYPFFSYSLFSLHDLPAALRPLYSIKRFITRNYFGRTGILNRAIRIIRRIDRKYLPRRLLGFQVGVWAIAE